MVSSLLLKVNFHMINSNGEKVHHWCIVPAKMNNVVTFVEM